MTCRSHAVAARSYRSRCAGLLAIAAFAVLAPGRSVAAPAPCALAIGQHVVLESDAVDPDVFLWDSRARLVAYASGTWDSTRDVIDHTVLAAPGTAATVVSCAPGAAHPKYTSDSVDAIGVKIVRGTFRGHFGWIVATDARTTPAPADAHAAR